MSHEHDHSVSSIRDRLAAVPRGRYGKDFVLGGVDGVVTTFAIAAGVVGANLSPSIVLILGAANLLADGFSMAASNYTGTRTEIEEAERLREVERRHIETTPDGEAREVREIFRNKGFSGDELESIVAVITADRERWIATMLAEEYGIAPTARTALRAAAHTFGAFVLCGMVPLIPFALGGLVAPGEEFAASIVLAVLTFAAIGAARSNWSPRSWWRTSAETLAIGAGAGAIAFVIGRGLRLLIGG